MKIRASQGHPVDVELGYTEQPPPAILYHDTVEKFPGTFEWYVQILHIPLFYCNLLCILSLSTRV